MRSVLLLTHLLRIETVSKLLECGRKSRSYVHIETLLQTVMYALCVVYNPINPHLALGPVFQACAGSCNAYYWRIKTILHWRRDELTWIKNGGNDRCSPCHCRQTMWTGEWPFQIPWTFWGLVRACQPPCWLYWRERCHPEAQVDPPLGRTPFPLSRQRRRSEDRWWDSRHPRLCPYQDSQAMWGACQSLNEHVQAHACPPRNKNCHWVLERDWRPCWEMSIHNTSLHEGPRHERCLYFRDIRR